MPRLPILTLLLLAAATGLDAHPFDEVRPKVEVEANLIDDSVTLRYIFEYRTIDSSLQEQSVNGDKSLDRNGDRKISLDEQNYRLDLYLEELLASARLRVGEQSLSLNKQLARSAVFKLNDPSPVDSVGNWRVGYLLVLQTDKNVFPAGKHHLTYYSADTRLTGDGFAGDGYRASIVEQDAKGIRRVVTPLDSFAEEIKVAGQRFHQFVIPLEVPAKVAVPSVGETEPNKAIEANGTPNGQTNPPDENIGNASQNAINRSRESFENTTTSQTEADERLLEGYIRDVKDGGLPMLLAVLAVFILGAWHALQPGHGKTLVAGYLIGTHGRPRDAITLGITVTCAHVSGVFILLGLWYGLEHVFPDTFADRRTFAASILMLAVGGTILLMGAVMLLKRVGKDPGHHHDVFGRHVGEHHHDDHGHDHSHGHGHGHGHGHHARIPEPVEGHGHSHGHGHAHHHHAHDRVPEPVGERSEHADDEGRGHVHSHDHGHHHDHAHHHHDHSHRHHHSHLHHADGDVRAPKKSHHHHDPAKMTTFEIIRLGIVGGLLPCPTAFVLGLLTIQQGEVVLGFVLLVIFSLGLAAVLTAIGLGMVATKAYLKKKNEDPSPAYKLFERYAPVLGALVITLIGYTLTVNALRTLGIVDVMAVFRA